MPPDRLSFEAGPLNRVKRCRYGNMLYSVHDKYIGRALDEYGEWAEDEMQLLHLFLQPGMDVIDVGANIGTHTLCFAAAVGPQGSVIAIEPQRVIYQMLTANVALNSLLNVVTLHTACGAGPGHLRVPAMRYDQASNFGAVRLSEDADGEYVPVVALDALGLDACHLLKIDVEGAELAVLQGAAQLISHTRPLIYLENHHTGAEGSALIEHLLGLDYHLFWHLSAYDNPDNFAGSEARIFGRMLDANMLAVTSDMAPAFAQLPAVQGPEDDWQQAFRRLGFDPSLGAASARDA